MCFRVTLQSYVRLLENNSKWSYMRVNVYNEEVDWVVDLTGNDHI